MPTRSGIRISALQEDLDELTRVDISSDSTTATISTEGTKDLILNTNEGTNSGSITIEDGASGDVKLATQNEVHLTGGSVGVGTTSPGSHPDEKNDLVIGDASGHHGMTIASGAGSIGTLRFAHSTTANNGEGWIDYHNTSKNMRFGTDGLNTRKTIDSSGNVTVSGNVDITGTKTVTGQIDVEGVTRKDNTLSTNASTANLEVSGNGSGNVVIDDVDIGGGAIDNVVIGGTTPAAGTLTTISITTPSITADGVTLTDNVITANRSNDNIEFNANGSGYVNINGNLITGGINLPNSDGNTGQLLRTDGNGQLAWFTAPLLLGQSDIQDARNTIGFSSITELDANTATGAHENIGAGSDSVLDQFDQTKYDSAWYLCLQRYDAADSSIEFAGFKTTIAQGTTDGSTFDAFDGTSQIIKTNNNDEIIATSSDIRSAVAKVRFKGQAGTLADGSTKSTFNALTFFRLGLGDNDSSGYTDGNIATKVTADLD